MKTEKSNDINDTSIFSWRHFITSSYNNREWSWLTAAGSLGKKSVSSVSQPGAERVCCASRWA